MRRYILTGTPGAGKTALLRLLEIQGLDVVEEAATDVIALQQALGRAEPHTWPGFIDAIVDLQIRRRERADLRPGPVQVHDRSPICTLALSRFLGLAPSPALQRELRRIEAEALFERRVLFVESLGFITPTAARRIDLAGALAFEKVHAETYGDCGYQLMRIAPAPLEKRAAAVRRLIEA